MDDAERRFRALAVEAGEHAQRRAWQRAGDAWVRAARVAVESGAVDAARQAFEAAGEAFRRDDRPVDARRALLGAVSLPQSPEEGAMVRVRLAGVLGELGDGGEALALCQEARGLVDAGPVLAIVLDTTIGVLQGYGRKDALRPLVDALEAAEGEGGIARWFRRGQLHRLDGELDAAAACFEEVLERLEGRPGAEAGAAAAEMELAEIAALEGDPGPAIAAFARGSALHAAAGRMALRYRCEAGRIRAAAGSGAESLLGVLDEGLAYAERRQLPALAVDLHLARGLARAVRDRAAAAADLAAAIEGAERLGDRLRAGRARLERAERVESEPARRRALLEQAVADLEDHVPLRDRARAALGG